MEVPPIEGILEIVRSASDATQGWNRLRSLLKKSKPSRLWDRFENVDPARDVESSRVWLQKLLPTVDCARPIHGIYLGLDTCSADIRGHNVEIATTTSCNPSSLDLNWIFGCNREHECHLIFGLLEMKRVYEQKMWMKFRDFAEYSLFLGYSGLILAEALNDQLLSESFLAAWGFHDGDIFPLGRGDNNKFTRLATYESENRSERDQPLEGFRPRLWPGPN